MPTTNHPGLIGPATPLPALDEATAAIVRAAYFQGSTERHMLAGPKTIFDQASLECCVSCAVTAAMEIEHSSSPALTAMFHYHVARYDRGLSMPGGRMTLDEGLTTRGDFGVCKHQLHPAAVNTTGWASKPSPPAYADALTHRPVRSFFSPGYLTVSGVSRVVDIRGRLKANRPVLIGFTLPQGYKTSIPDSRHTWDDPRAPLSADMHCVLLIGYDDARQAVRVQDSQGTGIFDRGCWWMGYNVADSAIVSTAYYFT